MSTQTRNIGGGGSSRNQKKSHIGSGGGSGGGGGGGNSGGGGDSSITHISHKKSDKTEKQEKSHPTPTAEQLRIAQIIETNKFEDPHMREKVATLIEMTQRSEEEVCCALNECDNNLERAVVFLLETLPVGAFEKSSKKKKNKTVNAAQDNLGDGDWTDNTVNVDKREKSRNRSNRNGRGNTDSRGWRGREARENERNSRGVERDDKANDNYRGGQRGGGRSGRGSNYVGRRGGGRVGGGRAVGGRTERADYNSRYNSNDDHQEVELWDNIIAQNAEKQQQHSQDDAWGDWDNEEYVGSLKNSKVFTTSNLPNQTAASVLSSGLTNNGSVGAAGNSATTELAAPPGLEHHLGTSVIGNAVNTAIQSPGSHLNTLLSNAVGTVQKLAEENNNSTSPNVGLQPSANTSLLQYSAAVSNSTSQLHQQQQQLQGVVVGNKSGGSPTNLMVSNTAPYGSGNNAQFSSAVDSFTNAANAAANLVQQVQKQQKQQQKQQQPQLASQLKASATLSAEQSQYFNSLTSQNTAASASAVAAASVQQQQQLSSYGQKQASVPFQASYANVFASAAGAVAPIGNTVNADPIVQLGNSQQSQARRPRAKLPPPSKIPSTAVEMPGDSLNNIGYLDVQFGALDFGTEEAFENIPEKFNNAATLESQQQQQQQTQQQQQLSKSLVPGSVQDVATYDNQNKAGVAAQQQSSLTGGIQSSHLDALAASYTQRTSQQQQHTQQMVNVGSSVGVGVGNANTTAMQPGSSALDQLTKSDHYSQASNNVAVAPSGYQSSYQNSVNAVTNKVTANVFQPSVAAAAAVAAAQAVYGNTAYGSVQSSGANTYQPQTYGSYQPNSVNSYQHQHTQNHQHQHQQVTGGAQVSSNMTVSSGTVVGGTSVTQNIPSVVGGVGSNSSSNNTANNNVIANASYLSSAYGPQPSTYQTNPGVYGNSGLSNNTGYSVNTSNSTSQYTSFNTSSKVKENVTNAAATVNTSHYDSVTGGASVNSNTSVSVASSANSGGTNSNNQNSSNITVQNTSTNLGNINTSAANVASGSGGSSGNIGSGVTSSGSSQSNSNNTSNISNNVTAGNSTITNTTGGNMGNSASTVGSTGASAVSVMAAAVTAVTTASSSTSINKTSGSGGGSGSSNTTTGNSGVGGVAGVTAAAAAAAAAAGASGIAPNIQMVSQYIQTSLPYYQQPVYSYEDLQMMQQRVPHVPGYYDLNYTPTSLGAGRDNLGSVAYSTMTDGRFARTDNNSSPVSNVSSTLSQQAGSSGPMLNVPYAYFYGGNVMPGSFQYGTPAIYPQIQAANTASGGQFPKPSYSTGYGSTNYDGLTQATPDYGKGTYPASVNQQSKSQNVVNPPQVATSSDITSSMYGKGHVALNKVNSYEKQSFHSATPPPFNMPNTQTAGGTSGQPYGMYLPTMPAGGHHMIHPPMHQFSVIPKYLSDHSYGQSPFKTLWMAGYTIHLAGIRIVLDNVKQLIAKRNLPPNRFIPHPIGLAKIELNRNNIYNNKIYLRVLSSSIIFYTQIYIYNDWEKQTQTNQISKQTNKPIIHYINYAINYIKINEYELKTKHKKKKPKKSQTKRNIHENYSIIN